MSRIQIIAIVFDLILLISVVILIKRGNLKEKYAISWLFGFAILFILSVSRKLLEQVSLFFGVYYAPSFLFLLAFFVVFIILLHFSIAISGIEKKYKILSQKMALLEEKMKRTSNT